MTIGKLGASVGLLLLAITVPASAVPSLCTADATNIVLNCGFETADFTNWVANPFSSDPWGVTNGDVNSGGQAATTGCVGQTCITGTPAQQASLAQTLPTTLGNTYALHFAFASAGQPGQELQVLWDGTVKLDLVNVDELPAEAYTNYSVAGLIGTGSDVLTFLARQDPGFNRLDDVQVDVTAIGTATPEPASVFLLGSGMLVCLRMARRRKA
jgi:hypothetical protein